MAATGALLSLTVLTVLILPSLPFTSAMSPPTPRRSPRRSTPSVPDETPSTPTLLSEPQKTATPTKSPAPTKPLSSRELSQILPDSNYVDLRVGPQELRPSHSLTNGQCFHWTALGDDDSNESPPTTPPTKTSAPSAWGTHDAKEWLGTLRTFHGSGNSRNVVLSIRETPTTTLYRVLFSSDADASDAKVDGMVRQYLQLDVPLTPLYQKWSESCTRLKTIATCLPGVRVVDQDPFECLVSFICSTNNNIPRITKILASVRKEYGSPLLTIGDTTFHSFPSLKELHSKATEDDLRSNCGLGYRAKYLMTTLQKLIDLGGESYLHSLRNEPDATQVQQALMQFAGVGAKVADCVALFSLLQPHAIPVDVHVLNICQRDYDVSGQIKQAKSMTPTLYALVGNCFREKFPNRPGWAHSLLFCAELPSFRAALPENLVQDMEHFSKQEKERKQELKAGSKKKRKSDSPR